MPVEHTGIRPARAVGNLNPATQADAGEKIRPPRLLAPLPIERDASRIPANDDADPIAMASGRHERAQQQLKIEIAKKYFIAKIYNLAATTIQLIDHISQYAKLNEKSRINPSVAATTLLTLGVAAFDCITAMVHYASVSRGGNGLPLGPNNGIANSIYRIATTAGVPDMKARKLGECLSLIMRAGLGISWIAHQNGRTAMGMVNNRVSMPETCRDLPSRIGEYLPRNISDDVTGLSPAGTLTATVFNQIFAMQATISTREGDRLSGGQTHACYVMNPETYCEFRAMAIQMTAFYGAIAAVSQHPLAQGLATILSGLSSASNSIENFANIGNRRRA